jgi:hypothetical protein
VSTFESGYCQNFGKITPAKCLGNLFYSDNYSSGRTRGIFWVSKPAASSESTCQSINQLIDAQAERIYPQYEVLAFAVREKLM